MEIPLIHVELTPDVALKLRVMMEAGVFDVREGNAILSFDIKGELKSVKTEQYYHVKKGDK